MAPPTIWTPETEDRFLDAIRRGNYIDAAAAYAGIVKQTLYNRLRKARRALSQIDEGDDAGLQALYDADADVRFLAALDEALGRAEQRDLAAVERAAHGYEVVKERQVLNERTGEVVTLTDRHWEFSWQAAAWRLERRWPQRWQRRPQIDVETDSQRVAVQIYIPSNEREAGSPTDVEAIDSDTAPAGAPDALPGE